MKRSSDLVVEARRRAGLSQRDLARRVGKPQSTIARWESSQATPSFESLQELMSACGLELDVAVRKLDDSFRPLIGDQLSLSPVARVRSMGGEVEAIARIAKALAKEDVDYVAIGAVGGAMHGSPLLLQDDELMICPATDTENERRLRRGLSALKGRRRELRDRYAGEHAIDVWSIPHSGKLAVARDPAGSFGYRDLRREASPHPIAEGVELPVISLLDLVRIGEASPWQNDRVAVPALRATLEEVRDREARRSRVAA